jgi:hypothetical protein
MVGERVAKSKSWPDSPRALAGRLRRAATFLRKIGIEIAFEREGRARTRIIRIITGPSSAPETGGARPSAWSAPSTDQPKLMPANAFASRGLRTVGDRADGSRLADGSTVRANSLKTIGETGADGTDANCPPRSEPGKTDTPAWRARL